MIIVKDMFNRLFIVIVKKEPIMIINLICVNNVLKINNNILRSETAAISMISIVNFNFLS